MEKREFKFGIHDAVWYKGQVARVEEASIFADPSGVRNIYLVQTSNHFYFYAYEEDLEAYIG